MNSPSTQARPTNVDPQEIAKFDSLAARWWDPEGDFKPLHDINPARLDYIDRRAGLLKKKVLDVGCGGGILAESMAGKGADVCGIDMAQAPLSVAEIHSKRSGIAVEYRMATVEELASDEAGTFDIVTCLEMLEHVPDPASVVEACARLVRPGGQVFFSTINRNAKSFLMAIVGAEYVLGLLPRGTHEYAKLIRPSELDDWVRAARLQLLDIVGLHYNPLLRNCSVGGSVDVNYMMHACMPIDDA